MTSQPRNSHRTVHEALSSHGVLRICPIAFAGFYLYHRRNKQERDRPEVKENIDEEAPVSVNDNSISAVLEYKQLGKFMFYDVKGILSLNDETIALSEKEIKALNIFASNQNLVVERDKLRQEIWEAEGVL